MRVKKLLAYCIVSLLVLAVGCGMFDRPRIENGYYVSHYHACGPEAVSKALSQYITILRTTKQISQDIQDSGNTLRFLASIIDKKGVQITCPSEIVEVCRKYGFAVIPVTSLDKLDPAKHVALVLVRKGISDWHWLCFPVDTFISDFYGDDTVVSTIYLLEPSYQLFNK